MSNRIPKPVSATPSVARRPDGSFVLVDGSDCNPATFAGGVPTAPGATVGARGAAVGVAEATDAAVGVAEVEGVAVALTGVAAVRRVPAQGALGMFAIQAHGGNVETTGGAALHVDVMNWSLIKVTVPFRDSALPLTVTPSARVMDIRAKIVPTKEEPDPRVAELVTCQKTLHGLPPLMKLTELIDAVTRSEVPWKIQTEFGSFWPSRVSVPVRASVAPPEL